MRHLTPLPNLRRSGSAGFLKLVQLEWRHTFSLKQLTLSGYLSLEALDKDDEMSQICVYCGIIPEVVLGEFCFC